MSSLLGTVWHVAHCRNRRAVAAAGGEGMARRPGAAVRAAVSDGVDLAAGRLLNAIPGEGAPPT